MGDEFMKVMISQVIHSEAVLLALLSIRLT